MTATLEHLDPKTLIIGANIRTAAVLDPDFTDNVKRLGVLEPIVGWRAPDGAVTVKMGQRRTLAAIAGDLATVPVLVDDQEPSGSERVIDQWSENHQRAEMSAADDAAAVGQLALFGLPAGEIAAALSLLQDDVEAAVKVARSETAAEYLSVLSLDDAAILADFEDDPEAFEALVAYTQNRWFDGGLEHVAQRIRDDRQEKEDRVALTQPYADRGVEVLTEEDAMKDRAVVGLKYLFKTGDDAKTPLSESVDPIEGQVVWTGFDYMSRDDAGRPVLKVRVGVRDPGKYGYEPIIPREVPQEKKKAAEMTDEEREASKQARAHVVESNKAWKSATRVRRNWLKSFGAIKKPLPDQARLIVAAMVWPVAVDVYQLELVGLDREKVSKETVRAAGPRALHLATAVTVSSVEHYLTDDAWRSQLTVAGPYLEALGKWGYALSDIETRMIKEAKAAK